MLELLKDKISIDGSRILDVGSGSGIVVAYMSRMASPTSIIVGIEIVHELISISRDNLISDSFEDKLITGNVIIQQGDGWKGVSKLGPFDAINGY